MGLGKISALVALICVNVSPPSQGLPWKPEEPTSRGFSGPRLSSRSGCRASNNEDPPVSPTENTFCSGDHVSWHSPLDNSESRIQHMLLTEDPQMQPVQTPFGVVTFLQVRHRLGAGSSLLWKKSREGRRVWVGEAQGMEEFLGPLPFSPPSEGLSVQFRQSEPAEMGEGGKGRAIWVGENGCS